MNETHLHMNNYTNLSTEKSLRKKPNRIENNALIALKGNKNFQNSCKDTKLRTNQGWRFASSAAERAQEAMA